MMNLTMKDIKVGDKFTQVVALGSYLFKDNIFVVDKVEEDKSAILLSIRRQKNIPGFAFMGNVYLSLAELNMAFKRVNNFVWSDWKFKSSNDSGKNHSYRYKTNGRITFVKICWGDKIFKGKATCHKDDLGVFDEQIGIELAYERAESKIKRYKEKMEQETISFKPGDRVQAINNHKRSQKFVFSDALGTVVRDCGDGDLLVEWDEGNATGCAGENKARWYIKKTNVKLIETKFTLEKVNGDILEAPVYYTLLHTIYAESEGNAVGLSRVIIDAFNIKEDLKEELKYWLAVGDYDGHGEDVVGDIVTYPHKNVVTLISKRKRHDSVSYYAIKKGLKRLKKHMENNDIRYLAMPTICCGYENLDWAKVEDIIKEVFSTCCIPITIKVYTLSV